MLVILPPSETKSDGGSLGPLDLDSLSLPQLTAVREKLITELVELAADVEAARVALGLGKAGGASAEGLQTALARNDSLWTSATAPALQPLHRCALRRPGRRLADQGAAGPRRAAARDRLRVVRRGPRRRSDPGLSPIGWLQAARAADAGIACGSRCWHPRCARPTADRLVVDLRSGSYQQLGRLPGAVTATVLTERPDGTRTVVSHFNKHHKGLLARALATTRAEPGDIRAVARVAEKAGLRAEIASSSELLVLT